MKVETIASMADEFDITPELAREILLIYADQRPVPPRAAAPEAPERERPPAREVDPFWKFSTFWQIAEPTVAWPLGVYNMAKLGMAASAGLPVKAGLPRAIGGLTAQELWASNRDPELATRFRTYLTSPKAQRPVRPKVPPLTTPAKAPPRVQPTGVKPTTARPRAGVIRSAGGIPPNVLSVNSWMAAAGILGSVLRGPAEEAAAELGIGQPPL
jgi:hypothetical protein